MQFILNGSLQSLVCSPLAIYRKIFKPPLNMVGYCLKRVIFVPCAIFIEVVEIEKSILAYLDGSILGFVCFCIFQWTIFISIAYRILCKMPFLSQYCRFFETIISKICRTLLTHILNCKSRGIAILYSFCRKLRWLISYISNLFFWTWETIPYPVGRFNSGLRMFLRLPMDYSSILYSFGRKFRWLISYISNLYSWTWTIPYPDPNNGPTGLLNTKETCYMNSMIQLLASSNRLIEEMDNFSENYRNENCRNLVDLLKCINGGEASVDEATEKLLTLQRDIGWAKESQQDTFELLSCLIRGVQGNSAEPVLPKILIAHTFTDRGTKIQQHLGLSLSLCGDYAEPPGVSIKYLIDQFFKPVLIDDDETKETKMTFYKTMPAVLILQIQANKWIEDSAKMIKPIYFIKYSSELEIKTHTFDTTEFKEVTGNYQLTAIVRHTGNVEGGHYVAYRKHHDKWYLVNDEYVEEFPFQMDIVPYILLYEIKRSD